MTEYESGPMDTELRRLFKSIRTIAVIGASAKEERPSNEVMATLREQGYRCIPVNPRLAGKRLMGEMVYPDLRSIPIKIDLVDVFRRGEAIGPIVDDAIAIGAKVIWMQIGVQNEEAVAKARAAGLIVVMDLCTKAELSRLNKLPDRWVPPGVIMVGNPDWWPFAVEEPCDPKQKGVNPPED